jgi:hypothetical protein
MLGKIVYSQLQSITVYLGRAAETLNVTSTFAATTNITTGSGSDTVNVQATTGPTYVSAPSGNTTVNVGSLAPVVGGIVDHVSGLLTYTGGSGSDVLNVDDTGNATAKSGTLTSTTLTGLALANGITYGQLRTVNVNLGPANYHFTIASTHVNTTVVNLGSGINTVNVQTTSGNTTVNASSGDDVLNVGSLAPVGGGVVNGIAGPLTLNGGVGQDVMYVDDTGSSGAKIGTLSANGLIGLLMPAGITYTAMRSVNLNLGSGSDTFTIASTDTASTIVNTGAGNDSVNVQAISGNTLVQGGSGNDTFTIGSTAPGTSHARRWQRQRQPHRGVGGRRFHAQRLEPEAF